MIHVNNEIGTINDIAAIGELTRSKGVLLHVDGTGGWIAEVSVNQQAFAHLLRDTRINRDMQGIQVAQVIDAVNESVDATKCQGLGDCHAGDTCLTHHLWCDLSLQIHEFLSGISLADLVTRREVQEVAQRQDQRRCNTKGVVAE